MKKLGKTQKDVLDALIRHGSWHRTCGWVWGGINNTERIMRRLVDLGMATLASEDFDDGDVPDAVFRPSVEALMAALEQANARIRELEGELSPKLRRRRKT